MPYEILSTPTTVSHDTADETSSGQIGAPVDTTTPGDAAAAANDIPWPEIPDGIYDARARLVTPEQARAALQAKAASMRRFSREVDWDPHFTPMIDALDKAGVDYGPALAALLKLEPAPVTRIERGAPALAPEPRLTALAAQSAGVERESATGELDDADIDADSSDDAGDADDADSDADSSDGADIGTQRSSDAGNACGDNSGNVDAVPSDPPTHTAAAKLPLDPPELHNLRASGLTDEEIRAFGARTESDPAVINELAGYLYTRKQVIDPHDKTRLVRVRELPGGRHFVLVIPCPQPDGSVVSRFRPRFPVPAWDQDKQTDKRDPDTGEYKGAKYISQSGAPAPIFYPRGVLHSDRLSDPTALLVFCEGEKKAWLLQWVLDTLGIRAAVIGLTGIDNAHDPERAKRQGIYALRPDLLDAVSGSTGRLDGRSCVIAFDYFKHKDRAHHEEWSRLLGEHPDTHERNVWAMCKRKPAREPKAAQRIADMLYEVGAAEVSFCVPPTAADGDEQPKGVDDLYVAAALAARGQTAEQHDLDRDCAQTLDHDAGRAAVDSKIRGAELLYHSQRSGEFGPERQPVRFMPPPSDEVGAPPAPHVETRAPSPELVAPKTGGATGRGARGKIAEQIRLRLIHDPSDPHRTAREMLRAAIDADARDILLDDQGRLVTVTITLAHACNYLTPIVEAIPLQPATLAGKVATYAELIQVKYTSEGEPYDVPVPPPRDVAYALHDLGKTAPLPRHVFATEVPLLANSSGRVVHENGYDKESGVTLARRDAGYAPPPDMHALTPEQIRAEMRGALEYLHDWLSDFVFASDVDRDVAVACALTIVGRLVLGRRIPAFAFGAPDQDAAKSLLVDVISVAFTGAVPRDIDPITTGSSIEERSSVRHDLFVNAGRRVVRMDEVEGSSLTSPTLQTVLTSGSVAYRKQQTTYWPVTTLTGNRLSLSRALTKRVLICQLNPQPLGTKHRRPQILNDTVVDRPRIVRAVLTLLCGRVHLLESGESPDALGGPLGDWSGVRRYVQGAILDAGGTDIAVAYLAAREQADAEDRDCQVLEQLVDYSARCGVSEWTAAQLTLALESEQSIFPELRSMLRARLRVGEGERLTVRRVEPYLRKLAGRRVASRQLVRSDSDDRRRGAQYSMRDVGAPAFHDVEG